MKNLYFLFFFLFLFFVSQAYLFTQDLGWSDEEASAPTLKQEMVIGEGEDEELAIKDAMLKYAMDKVRENIDRRIYRREEERIQKMIKKNPQDYIKLIKKGPYNQKRMSIKVLLTMDLPRLMSDLKSDTQFSLLKHHSIIIACEAIPSTADVRKDAVNTIRNILDDYASAVKTYDSLQEAVRTELGRGNVDPYTNIDTVKSILLHEADLLCILSITNVEKSSYDSYKNGYWLTATVHAEVIEKVTGKTIAKTVRTSDLLEGVNSAGIGVEEVRKRAINKVCEVLGKKLLVAIRDEFGGESGYSEKLFTLIFDGLTNDQKQNVRKMVSRLEKEGIWDVQGKPMETERLIRFSVQSKKIKDLPNYVVQKFSFLDLKIYNQTQSSIWFRPISFE